jgi:hypothetical protein
MNAAAGPGPLLGSVTPSPFSGPGPLDHHNEDHSAFVPTANPAHPPFIDAVADSNGLEQSQKLGLNFHRNPSITLLGWTVKATTIGRTPDAEAA